MRMKVKAVVALCVVGLLPTGCLHVGREVDLVSKLGIEQTDRIVVGVLETPKDYNPAAFDICDKDMIGMILSDFRHAKGVRSAKYETIGWVTFFPEGQREVKLEIYVDASGGIVELGTRSYAFDGKLLEMIRRYRKEKQMRNTPHAAGRPGYRGTESVGAPLANDQQRVENGPIPERGFA